MERSHITTITNHKSSKVSHPPSLVRHSTSRPLLSSSHHHNHDNQSEAMYSKMKTKLLILALVGLSLGSPIPMTGDVEVLWDDTYSKATTLYAVSLDSLSIPHPPPSPPSSASASCQQTPCPPVAGIITKLDPHTLLRLVANANAKRTAESDDIFTTTNDESKSDDSESAEDSLLPPIPPSHKQRNWALSIGLLIS